MSGDDAVDGAARRAHHDFVGQPHSEDEGPIAVAEASADGLSSREQPLGPLGPPLVRRSSGAPPPRAASCSSSPRPR
jgi:hypothetical protein